MRTKSFKARKCQICSQPMRKHGRTTAGAQRWRCLPCGATYTFRRQEQTRQATFTVFIDYVLGKTAQNQIDGTSTERSTRRPYPRSRSRAATQPQPSATAPTWTPNARPSLPEAPSSRTAAAPVTTDSEHDHAAEGNGAQQRRQLRLFRVRPPGARDTPARP